MGQNSILGRGLVLPFQRAGNDFEVGEELDSVRSSLQMIFGTRCAGARRGGEIPFNQQLGNLLELVRHRQLEDPGTRQLADYYVVDSIRRNEPRVIIKGVQYRIDRGKMKLSLILRYDVISKNVPGNRVIAENVRQEIQV